MTTLTLSDVNKRYANGAHAVRGVNMVVEDGEFIVFVGPSGCGKSTLLRMIAGLESISDGTISIDEKVINEISPAERDVAMVFQNYALYPHMTVRGNMSYGLKNRGISKSEIAGIVAETAKLLEIEDFLDRQPHQLSGGQRQRVAMGRAIVRSPKVFLFDEPLSNLDAKLRVQMRIEIKRLQNRLGVTTVYVTHDQTEAMTLADRLAVINDGLVEQMGSPMELYNDPQTLFVAAFIGSPSMNFIDVELKDDTILIGDTDIPCPGHLKHTGKAVLGVRPEHFSMPASGMCELTMDVDVVEKLGADTLAHGKISGCPEELVVKLAGDSNIDTQNSVRVAIDTSKLMLFDPDTGKRI